MNTIRQFLLIAAFLGFRGVALGAFGTHGLESTLVENGREDTCQTASECHMYHALALLAVAWMASLERFPAKFVRWSGILLTIGALIFAGSLYILAIFDLDFMGAIAPIGGACLLAGWGLMGYATWMSE